MAPSVGVPVCLIKVNAPPANVLCVGGGVGVRMCVCVCVCVRTCNSAGYEVQLPPWLTVVFICGFNSFLQCTSLFPVWGGYGGPLQCTCCTDCPWWLWEVGQESRICITLLCFMALTHVCDIVDIVIYVNANMQHKT